MFFFVKDIFVFQYFNLASGLFYGIFEARISSVGLKTIII